MTEQWHRTVREVNRSLLREKEAIYWDATKEADNRLIMEVSFTEKVCQRSMFIVSCRQLDVPNIVAVTASWIQ